MWGPYRRSPQGAARWRTAPIQGLVAQWIETFKDFPPRNKAASFTVSDVMEKITTASPNQN